MRSRLALGTLFAATTVSLTATVTGLAGVTGGAEGPVAFLAPPPAAAVGLVPFDDCDALVQWYVEQALPDVGPYGLGGWPVRELGALDSRALVLSSANGFAGAETTVADRVVAGTAQDSVGSSDTGTNVQEVGVDEPDRAKTDGRVVVHVRRHELVVTDVTGPEAREVGSLTLPRDLSGAELLLAGDTVLVVAPQNDWGRGWGGPLVDSVGFMSFPAPVAQRSRLLEVSLSDPTSPVVVSDQTFGGSLLSARQHGDTVRLVLSTSGPVLDFVQPNRERTRKEATEENRQILRASGIDDWLPTVSVDDGESEPLVSCEDVRHPTSDAGYGTISVVTVDASDPTDLDTLGVTTDGQTVYSSADRLYLATWGGRNTTDVHAFALDGPTTAYVASGEVSGVVQDRWSMDEHDGVLRVAVAHGPGWSPKENGITTLREDGDELVVVGAVRGLGPDEEIKSVRWFDDLAIVVTFRQTDPLYTVDLSDPARPRTLGELKIPGFSEYLHPIGDNRLLGLGQDATMLGEVVGGQVSLFDVTDLGDPRRLDTLALGKQVAPAAGYDPRTFTWLAERGTGLAVVEDQWNGRASLVEIGVLAGGALTSGDEWSLPRWNAGTSRALPLPDGSSVAVVTDEVRLVTLSPR